MESGGHLFSDKKLFMLIWPLMIEQTLAITLGMADIIMVSSLGEAAVSGVSLVDTVFILINGLFAALSTGGAVVCAQFIGKKRNDMASKAAIQLLYTVLAGAMLMVIAGFFWGRGLLSLLFGKINSDVMANSQIYFKFMLASLPSVALYNGCAALFRAQGNSKVSMSTALLINIIHIGSNAFLLFGLHWGVYGVAVSTLVSRTIAALVLLSLLRGKRRAGRNANVPSFGGGIMNAESANAETSRFAISIRGIRKVSFDLSLVKKILGIGIPNGLENSMFQLGKIVLLSLVSVFGTGAIAANAAANTISSFEVLPASSISLALLTVVGQCMGAGRNDEAVYYTKKLLLIAYVGMAVLNVPLLLSSKWIIGIYHMSPETSKLGWQMLMIHGVCGMVFWPASFTLPNALRAAGEAKYTMMVSLLSVWIVRIGMSYVFGVGLGFGALGVWMAMICDWVVRVLFFTGRFARGKWKMLKLV